MGTEFIQSSANDYSKNITYEEYMDTCRKNGFDYTVVGRQEYIPVIDFFELRSGSVMLPCRDVKNGREIIRDFKSDGMGGHFYIRKLLFPEDPFFTRLKNWLIRYKESDV